jgi:exodeoxyribonuclease-5
MNILDSPFDLTSGQIDALTKMKSLIDNFDKRAFSVKYTIQGYAGTGKTTIVPNVIKYARHTGIFDNIFVLAPTNKAKLVLSTKLDSVRGMYDISTLHSLLYGEPDEEDGENKWVLSTNVRNSLLLVDESSMIDLKLYEDVMEACDSCLVIFFGDIFQLEQIGKPSPIFTDLDKSELKEVKRQDNSILMLATYIRDNNVNVYTETEDIVVVTKNEALAGIVDDLQNPEKEDTVFIVATNNTRNKLNSVIRKQLGHNDMLNKRDKLISISNSEKLVNGEIFSVDDYEYVDTVPLYVYDKYKPIECDVHLYKINGVYAMLVNIDAASLTHQQINKGVSSLFTLFGEHYKHYLQQKKKKIILEDVDKYEYINKLSKSVIICTYGYAISCHKSQGSQFKSVYVHQDYSAKSWNSAKWFYTAITRAVEKVYVVPNHEYQRKIVL